MGTRLYFSLQRKVTGSDFNRLLSLLKERGHDVAPLKRCEGGICFLVDGKDVGKDIRFSARGWTPLTHTDGAFTNDVWGPDEYTAPEWKSENRLCVQNLDRGPLSALTSSEIADVRADVVTALGVAENTIETENRGIEASDTPELVRRFLNFDRAEAVAAWTIPSEEWPGAEKERLFKCWNCNTRLPEFYFTLDSVEHTTSFECVLARYAFKSPPWCDHCELENRYVKWTPSVAKRLRTK